MVHLAFTFSPLDMRLGRVAGALFGGPPQGLMARMMGAVGATDRDAIDALGAGLQGSDRPLVTAFGVMGLAGAPGARAGRPAREEDAPDPASPGYLRAVNEGAVAHWAERGVRASIVRLAPSVHGEGDKGLIPQIAAAARKRAEAIYVGDGAARWCGVHRSDAATLFRLALERGAAGRVYHGAGDEGLSFRDIAGTVGRRFGLPVASRTLVEAQARLGWIAPFVAADNPATSLRTQEELGWRPTGPTLAEDLSRDDYFAG